MPTIHTGNGPTHYDAYNDVQGNQNNTTNIINNYNQHTVPKIDLNNINVLDVLSAASIKSARWNFNLANHEIKMPNADSEMGKMLEDVQDWVKNPGEHRVLWIRGASGTGKTFLLRALCKDLDAKGNLGASFFFSGSDSSSALFPTIAHHLHLAWPPLAQVTKETLKYDCSISELLADQMQRLIVTPVTRSTGFRRKVVVIDGMDQCSDEASDKISALIAPGGKDQCPSILWVISSHSTLHRLENSEVTTIDIDRQDYTEDIRELLSNRLQGGRLKGHYGWPPQKRDVNKLCSLSGGLFIYAEHLSKFILDKDRDPQERLKKVLRGPQEEYYPPEEMDVIHKRALSRIPIDEYERIVREVVGLVVHAARPLTFTTIENLLQMKRGSAWTCLEKLRSVFSVPDIDETGPHGDVIIIHTLFREFISNPERSTIHYIDPVDQHTHIARDCLQTLSALLRYDICEIKDFQTRKVDVEDLEDLRLDRIGNTLHYATSHWATHLSQAKITSDSDPIVADLNRFVQIHIVLWIETASVLDLEDLILPSLQKAVAAVKDILPRLANRLSEIEDIVAKNIRDVGKAPLAIYPIWHAANMGISGFDALVPQPSQQPTETETTQTIQAPEAVNNFADNKVYEQLSKMSTKGVSWDSDLPKGWNPAEDPTDQVRIILEWLQSDQSDSSERIYWLHGPSGGGKSSIMRSLCKILDDEKMLGASYFVPNEQITREHECLPWNAKSEDEAENSPYRRQKAFLISIASQLHSSRPLMSQRTEEILRQNFPLYYTSKNDQLRRLIYEPILHLKNQTTVIVIDNLHCGGSKYWWQNVAKMLVDAAEQWSYLPVFWVITSHTKPSLKDLFKDSPMVKRYHLCKDSDAAPTSDRMGKKREAQTSGKPRAPPNRVATQERKQESRRSRRSSVSPSSDEAPRRGLPNIFASDDSETQETPRTDTPQRRNGLPTSHMGNLMRKRPETSRRRRQSPSPSMSDDSAANGTPGRTEKPSRRNRQRGGRY